MALVTTSVAEKPVVIFSSSSCPIGHSVKTLIRSFGANPTMYELDQIPEGQQMERELRQMGCRPREPAVFIGQQFVGGAKQLISLNIQNQLAPLLLAAGAIFLWSGKQT